MWMIKEEKRKFLPRAREAHFPVDQRCIPFFDTKPINQLKENITCLASKRPLTNRID